MTDDTIRADGFHAAPGVDAWRVLFGGAYAHWRTASLAEGVALLEAIADAVADLDRRPDVDVRPRDVVVRTMRPDGRLDAVDVAIAQRVSTAADGLGLEADPSTLQVMNIGVAIGPDADVSPFLNAAFGYVDFEGDCVDPYRRGIGFAFQPLDRTGRGRTHVDVSVPAEVAEARVAAMLAAGGRMADDSHAPDWWTLASPDNHGIDIAAWPDVKGP
jgi:4a-hydroxytetrahydrobiopterin dehydratase